MLSHLRSLPEPAISPRTVENGIGAGPGSLMRPCFAGSRTTSNSSGFWPHSKVVRAKKATKATLTRVRSSFMKINPSPMSALRFRTLPTRLVSWAIRAPGRPHRFGCYIRRYLPNPNLGYEERDDSNVRPQSKPIGIASRNVPAIFSRLKARNSCRIQS
jgi:hypothetical protein